MTRSTKVLQLAQLPEPVLEAVFAKCDVRTR